MPRETEKGKIFEPETGKVYKNRGGGNYICITGGAFSSVMKNLASGWIFTAYICRQYTDNTIEWDYSSGGRFDN